VGDIVEDLAAVVDFVRQSANGARSGEIAKALKEIPQRTLQRWLKSLVESGLLLQEGKGPAARYRFLGVVEEQKQTAAQQAGPAEEKPEEVVAPLSAEGAEIPLGILRVKCVHTMRPMG
jgi:DNA-binding IclR family transcriptional regulator